jgi:hypothetical protein
MHDSDQFSVNLTHICGRNAVRLYELLIQVPRGFSQEGGVFARTASICGGFSSLAATAGTLP